jgi:hypothetical protein
LATVLTRDQVRQLLSYDPETGVLRWSSEAASNWRGRVAGYIGGNGYRVLTIRGHRYRAARLIWVLQTGRWPARIVDHQDRDRSNDRWSNLRPATLGQNNANAGLRGDNRSGFKGVSLCRKTGRWRAAISLNGRPTNLGRYPTPKAAALAYDAAAIAERGEFAAVNFPQTHQRGAR